MPCTLAQRHPCGSHDLSVECWDPYVSSLELMHTCQARCLTVISMVCVMHERDWPLLTCASLHPRFMTCHELVLMMALHTEPNSKQKGGARDKRLAYCATSGHASLTLILHACTPQTPLLIPLEHSRLLRSQRGQD